MESIGVLLFISLIMTTRYFHDVVDCTVDRDLRLFYDYSSGKEDDRLRLVHLKIKNIVTI